ncbi:hypothetical protein CR162_21365 [Pseudoroseomonas rhizosphaerae]|uniref:Phage virion morphogenesis protein n=2 Tax=Teichococcus rhizosphaerae TaxID=1335062 RepID=A0A2C7A5Q1_9PROT|nr:hypothetical protein CR162_21365 [Pseudoroseomonas rhizosphaerae]
MHFDGYGAFAKHLRKVASKVEAAQRRGLRQGAAMMAATAKGMHGEYQPSDRVSNAWAPLAPRTVAERTRRGFSPDEPLLRTGALRDSIGFSVQGDEALVGSTSPLAVHHEKGTARIPPRPVFSKTAVIHGRGAARLVGAHVAATMASMPVDALLKKKP